MNATTEMSTSPIPNATLPTRKPLIQVRELGKQYGEIEVLRGVDLEIAKSEVVCVIGPSGSGKSTLLRCIARSRNL